MVEIAFHSWDAVSYLALLPELPAPEPVRAALSLTPAAPRYARALATDLEVRTMAGRGFAPKDPDRKTGRTTDPIPHTTIPFVPGSQPALPRLTTTDPELGEVIVDWHPMTVEWWRVWSEAAQSDTFTATDWMVLLETAYLHHQFWNGDSKVGAEIRLRVAKFGATPEDRARLRMFFADADRKDAERGVSSGQPAPASPYGGLRAVQGGKPS